MADAQVNKAVNPQQALRPAPAGAADAARKRAMMGELQARLKFNEKLKYVTNQIHSAKNLTEILVRLSPKILHLFNADRITIYSLDPERKELFSRFLVGKDVKEIRVPVSPASIAGYTAFARRLVNVHDVYDSGELKHMDPNLRFDQSWDEKTGYRTSQVLAVPIVFDRKVLGVTQLINKKEGGAFTKFDETNVTEITRVLGVAFHNQARMVHTRFDYLITQNIVTENELKQAVAAARESKRDIDKVLMEDLKVKKKDLGASLGQFYGCKFVEYSTSLFVQRELLRGLNLAYLKKALWIPVSLVDGHATIIIDNPRDPKVLEIKGLVKAKS